MCNRCVSKEDHHCPWFNICIGEYNFRYFLLFLIVNSFASHYISKTSYAVLLSTATRVGWHPPPPPFPPSSSFSQFLLSWISPPKLWKRLKTMFISRWTLLEATVPYHTFVGMLNLFSHLLTYIVVGFLCIQLHSALTNKTTYESGKVPIVFLFFSFSFLFHSSNTFFSGSMFDTFVVSQRSWFVPKRTAVKSISIPKQRPMKSSSIKRLLMSSRVTSKYHQLTCTPRDP